MTITENRADVPPPDGPPEEPPAVPAWRRAPVASVLAIWVVLTILLVAFALIVPPRLMGYAASPTMREIKSTFTAFSLAAAPVAALVWAVLLYSLLRWRHRGSEPPEQAGPAVRGNTKVQTVWLVVSSALCLFLLVWGLVVLQPSAGEAASTAPPLVVDVTGNQWAWTFDYPSVPGAESDTLYLPVNRRVLFRVTSKDVIHSFWIVEMGVKIDANPGETTTISVTPDRLGTFTVRCAELCGLFHSYMQTTAHVVSAADFDRAVGSSVANLPPAQEDAPPVPAAPQPSGTTTPRADESPGPSPTVAPGATR